MPSTKTPTIRSAYSPHNPKLYAISITSPSLTHQSFKDECDVNNIMAKYKKGQIVDHVQQNEGFYGDFSEIPDYQEAMNIVAAADDMFMSLPSDLRARFQNDPALYLAFCEDPANHAEMRELGLLKPAATPEDGAGGVPPEQTPPTPSEPLTPLEEAVAASKTPKK